MARYNANRIPYHKQEKLISALCEVLCRLKTISAVRNFLKDLLNRQERAMLVRRLLIAEMLVEKRTYREIVDALGCGTTTIARVERWLKFGRGGYAKAVAAKKQ